MHHLALGTSARGHDIQGDIQEHENHDDILDHEIQDPENLPNLNPSPMPEQRDQVQNTLYPLRWRTNPRIRVSRKAY